MEPEIKSNSIDWHLFRKNIENQEFHDVYQMVDTWGDIDAVKLVIMILCEAMERIKEIEK